MVLKSKLIKCIIYLITIIEGIIITYAEKLSTFNMHIENNEIVQRVIEK